MKRKEMIPLTNEETKSYKNKKYVKYAKKGFSTDDDNKDDDHKVRDAQKNIEELLIVFVI